MALYDDEIFELMKVFRESHFSGLEVLTDKTTIRLGTFFDNLHGVDHGNRFNSSAISSEASSSLPIPVISSLSPPNIFILTSPELGILRFGKNGQVPVGGAEVNPNDVVAEIEVLKNMVPVISTVRGIILESYGNPGEFVEYGQKLFKISVIPESKVQSRQTK